MNKLLPIGSVVLLKEANKRIMIYGRLQKKPNKEGVYDYIACPYPEGNIDSNKGILFNHKDIERIYFLGFQDKEELDYSELIDKDYEQIKSRY